jgi:uncharacterized protein YggE
MTGRHERAPAGLPLKGVIAALAAALLAVPVARAGDTNTISVAGSATVKGKPSVVTITATVTGEAELAADASVKYGDTKKKATAALAALKLADLSVEPMGASIDAGTDAAAQQRIMQGMGGEGTKQRVRITEQLHLVLKNADKVDPAKLTEQVLKVVDAARDAGLQVGPPAPRNWYEMQAQANSGTSSSGLASYKIADVSALQEQAYKEAMADARKRAQRLADLSGVKLGRVVSAQDQGVNASGEMTSGPAQAKEATSSTMTDIPVTVRLSVQFEIEKP